MLKPESVATPKRIVPFDTGAFKSNRFSDYMHSAMRYEDFLLEPIPDMPNRLVARFYESNASYFRGNPATVEIPPLEFEAICYHNLIHSEGLASYDDRNSTVEIQSERNLILDSDIVLLVVMPTVFLDVPELRGRIVRDWHAQVRTYPIHRCNPNEYTLLIYQEIESYLKAENYL